MTMMRHFPIARSAESSAAVRQPTPTMPKREREETQDEAKDLRKAERKQRVEAKRLQKAEAKRARIDEALGIVRETEAPRAVESEQPSATVRHTAKKKPSAAAKMVRRDKNVRVLDLVVGKGDVVKVGQKAVKVAYVGRLGGFEGSIFDQGHLTCGLGQTGKRSVIEGWNIGLPGARVGGTRRLIIPPVAGYGMEAQGKAIPAGSTLFFDLTVLPGAGLSAAPKVKKPKSQGDASLMAADAEAPSDSGSDDSGIDDDAECPQLVPASAARCAR
jgi:FKBP-type peptidyl-prolyl cis-trans isomerase